MPNQPSVALGTAGVSLVQLTAAYAAVASGRFPVRARGLPTEQEQEGGFASFFSSSGSLEPGRDRAAMLELLWAAANDGTGRRAALRVPTFGKTGTSQDNRDALFIGFAGDLVVGVWVGRDDNSSLGKVTGGTLPARIWRDFMASAVAIDGRAGPSLPRRYPAPGEDDRPPVQNPSPLPEDWSESTEKLRELANALKELFDKQ